MTKSNEDYVTNILVEAKRLLEEELEWLQGCLYIQDSNNNYTGACAIGAIGIATENLGATTQLEMEAYIRLEKTVTPVGELIPAFNDNPSTTKEDI